MGISIQINGRRVVAQKGEMLLSVLGRSGIRVPTLCSMRGLSPTGSCRMCVVEVQGQENLVPACSFPVENQISVTTHSPRVMNARKMNVELLLASHPDDCLYCERNGTCELQKLAEELNVRERRIPLKKNNLPVDRSSPAVIRDPSKCILCGRCVRVCEEIMHTSTLDFAFRGNELQISTTLGQLLQFSNCTACGQCVIACPTGALTEHGVLDKMLELLVRPDKRVVVQYTPAAAVSLFEKLGMKPGMKGTRLLHSLLERCGFEGVYETSHGAWLMMQDHARMLAGRKTGTGELPLITSSCPAWIRYADQFYPELGSLLSPLRSPQQIMGRMIRDQMQQDASGEGREVVSVLVTSCTAAKREAMSDPVERSEPPLINLVLTPRELLRLFRILGLDHHAGNPDPSVATFSAGGPEGILSGVAGGEAEGVLRMLHEQSSGEWADPPKLQRFRIHKPYRETVLESGGRILRVGAVNGLAHATEVLEELKKGSRHLDFLEVMACPWGCVNGGGQPIPAPEASLRNWSRILYDLAR